MEIYIKYFDDEITKIEKISKGDWIDLRSAEEVEIKAGELRLIRLGVGMILPEGYEARLNWLHEPRIPRDGGTLEESMLTKNLIGSECEYREAVPAVKYRKKLLERYGVEKGMKINFAEAFASCEYGAPLTEEAEKELLPF